MERHIMIKKMVIVMSIVCIPLLLNGMEILKHNKKKKNSDEIIEMERKSTDVPHLNLSNVTEPLQLSKNGKASIKSLSQIQTLKTVQSTYRKNTSRGSEHEGVVREKSYFHQRNRPNMATSSGIVINTTDNKDIQTPTINVGTQSDLRTSQFLEQLEKDVKGEKPLKSARGKKKQIELVSSDMLEDKLAFSEKNMWGLLQRANPAFYNHAQQNYLSLDDVMDCPYTFDSNILPQVYTFAKKYQLPLEEMMEMAHLLEKVDIEPGALAEFLIKHHDDLEDGLDVKALTKHFEDIQKKNPDDYINLMLDFIRRTCFGEENKGPSALHAAHVAMQSKEISSQRTKIMYQWIGFGVTIISALAAAAWGAYGQATGTNPTNAPTMMPTYSPTNTPTFMPTGAPT
jgi:hypothetical protein